MLKRKKYEIMFILNVFENERVKEATLSILKGNNCSIEKVEDIGVKTLAYPIKKQNKGYYCLVYFQAQPNAIKDLDNEIKLKEDILKYMCIVYSDKKIKSSGNGVMTNTRSSSQSGITKPYSHPYNRKYSHGGQQGQEVESK